MSKIVSVSKREHMTASIVTEQTIFCSSVLGFSSACFYWKRYIAKTKTNAAEIAISQGWEFKKKKWLCPACTCEMQLPRNK